MDEIPKTGTAEFCRNRCPQSMTVHSYLVERGSYSVAYLRGVCGEGLGGEGPGLPEPSKMQKHGKFCQTYATPRRHARFCVHFIHDASASIRGQEETGAVGRASPGFLACCQEQHSATSWRETPKSQSHPLQLKERIHLGARCAHCVHLLFLSGSDVPERCLYRSSQSLPLIPQSLSLSPQPHDSHLQSSAVRV